VTHPEAEAIKAVVRRNTEQVQGQGDFVLFDELFADDFVDHTPQPGTSPNKAGVLILYKRLRDAFPDFRPEIHWQTVDGDVVTTYKIYHGTHLGDFLGIAPTGKAIQFETVDAMRVRGGIGMPPRSTFWRDLLALSRRHVRLGVTKVSP
jgi:predicted ester cyclase